MTVQDDAGLFSADGIARAIEQFENATFQSPTQYVVVTRATVPVEKRSELDQIIAARDENARNRFFQTWARELAAETGGRASVLTLVYRHETGMIQAFTVTDRETDIFRTFGDRKARDVSNEYLKALRTVRNQKLDGVAANKEMDEALLAATTLVINELKDTSAPAGAAGGLVGRGEQIRADREGGGLMGWICIGLAVLLGVWLIMGLIRAFSGGGGGGGPGGGGGGFMPSLFGGLFGAMAGMWLYNSFFGGGYTGSDAMASDNYGADTGDTGAGDYDRGAAGGDGDWGDGSGDWGGGGDWGGDFGGGGDW
jgi:uncharacterized protein